jgi:lipoteichoic acid synthase
MNLIVARKIICLTLSFMVVLFLIRLRVIDFDLISIFKTPGIVPHILLSSYYDWVVAIIMGTLFILMSLLARNSRRALRIVFGSFIVCIVLCVFFALVNIMAVHVLKVPLNYQWIYYSDFFGSSETRKVIMSAVPWQLLINFLILSGAMLATGLGLNHLILKYGNMKYTVIGMVCLTCLFIYYFIAAGNSMKYYGRSYNKMANPLVVFMKSIFVSFKDPNKLFTDYLPEDFESFQHKEIARLTNAQSPAPSKIRNVIIYVMESVQSEYVSGYGNKYEVTPNIKSHLHEAAVFTDFYAHLPVTNSSMVSLLTSMYPMISYKCLSKEFPQINWPSLSSELKNRNFQTAFFHASDNRFQRMDEFLSFRKFDKVSDYRDILCNKDILVGSTSAWKYLDGIDEGCMVDAFKKWLTKDKARDPFFAMLWTIQTHYPYFPPGVEKDYGVGNKDLNRYLNAIRYSDEMLEKLLADLKKKGLMESTLVVVVGDHGEAFGQHDQMGHGSEIYEENVKVPLIFINPLLFHGEKISVIGGQVDLAPTIMQILRQPSPGEWQGTSLLDSNRTNRAYFFNPHSYYLFGYREGNYKIIYNANWNETMVFDLTKDPGEVNNIADEMPELVNLSSKRLAHWVRSHSMILNERIAQTKARKRAGVRFSR